MCNTISSLLLEGLISKTSSLDKDLSGMTLRDLWDNSSNNVNKPLAPPLGLSVSRANVGKDNLLKESQRLLSPCWAYLHYHETSLYLKSSVRGPVSICDRRDETRLSHISWRHDRTPCCAPFLSTLPPRTFTVFLSITYSWYSQICRWMNGWIRSLVLIFWFLLLWLN